MATLLSACLTNSSETLQPSCLRALGMQCPPAASWLDAQALSGGGGDGEAGAPSQLHLALGAEEGEMTVTWVTQHQCPQSFVAFGDDVAALTRRSQAATWTYMVPRRWWQPRTMVWIHTARLDGLRSRQGFAYTVGDNETAGCSALRDPIRARTPPSRSVLPLRVELMADVGSIALLGFETWRALNERSAELDTDLVVHAGDVSYAGMDVSLPLLNVSSGDEWEPLWDLYGRAHEAVTRRRAYQIGIGNHEAWYNWTAVRHRYPMAAQMAAEGRPPPANGDRSPRPLPITPMPPITPKAIAPLPIAPSHVAPPAEPPFWYSFESGGVHWTMLSSEHPYEAGTPQHSWASAALASVDRAVTPWSAVAFHRPMYSSDESEYDAHRPGARLQLHFEPLLLRWRVDLVVSGHLHAYERIHPNVAGRVVCTPFHAPGGEPTYEQPSAPVYLVVGHGGAQQAESWVTPAPEWSAVRLANGCEYSPSGKRRCGARWAYTDTFGWAHADFLNATHARVHTEMVSGEIGDAFWIVRNTTS
jgi:hypothetical protein